MSGSKGKSSSEVAGTAKKGQGIMTEIKIKIIVKQGKNILDIIHFYNINCSTTGTILKNKNMITEHVDFPVPMMSTIIFKNYGKVKEEMEKFLTVCLHNLHQCPS